MLALIFTDLGAARCQNVCLTALSTAAMDDSKGNLTWLFDLYPCLIDLLLQYLMFIDIKVLAVRESTSFKHYERISLAIAENIIIGADYTLVLVDSSYISCVMTLKGLMRRNRPEKLKKCRAVIEASTGQTLNNLRKMDELKDDHRELMKSAPWRILASKIVYEHEQRLGLFDEVERKLNSLSEESLLIRAAAKRLTDSQKEQSQRPINDFANSKEAFITSHVRR